MSAISDYERAVSLFELIEGEGQFAKWESAWSAWGADTSTEGILQYLEEARGVDIPYYRQVQLGGGTMGVDKAASGATKGYTAEFTGSLSSQIDSNVVTRGAVKTPINTATEVIEGTSRMSAKIGLREAGKFVVGSVVPAVAAAGVGISLGKTIDSTLYNLNPDFWDSRGMSSLNPETWNSITSGYDGTAGTLFDLIFGLNSDGTTQAYIDEDGMSYLAWWLSQQGAFASGAQATSDIDLPVGVKDPIPFSNDRRIDYVKRNGTTDYDNAPNYNTQEPRVGVVWFANNYSSDRTYIIDIACISVFRNNPNISGVQSYTYKGETVWYVPMTYSNRQMRYGTSIPPLATLEYQSLRYTTEYLGPVAWTVAYGTISGPIEGISDQPDAQLPTTSTWTDPQSTKQSLQQQYPQLWDGAKHQDYVDESGQNKNKTFIPINLPNANSNRDVQPTSGNRRQNDPLIDPDTATDTLIDTITKLITNTPAPNPPTTGSGDSPTTVVPEGSASSLWAVYNPTQAQVDAFGSWLWSSDLVEQIKKLFNDPMQAIIGIHKVFATPATGGSQNIKCGYIDSGVPAAVVTSQYTTVDCGTVRLNEYFGNVFDYAPYTEVSLYLPFIGIVKLDIADVMRSSINVKYHVDVITGACLADVKVTRDGGGGVLYQYSGSAIVTYPLSSGSYASALTGILSIAGGVAATIASGGALAPAALGAAVGVSRLHTDVQKSGSFSGAAGAMGSKKPYLIISRPQTAMPSSYKHLEGQPANHYTKLSKASGYVKVRSVIVSGLNATDTELDMIQEALQQGVEL